MSGSLTDTSRCEPNLVPVLDMVFQLITFFMLVVNFKTTSVDRELMLPVIGSARPAEEESNSELLILNIRADGRVLVRGEAKDDIAGFIGVESRGIAADKKLPHGSPLPVRVVVRGDRNLSVKQLLDVTDACRANGFDKFDFLVTRSASGSRAAP
jgi:biopolymer transport protein ExbD